ncbi:TIR domain-containing protein [Flavisolibacter sp. BT320]|nr:TIR domain-containing protein [Flavisolibacter longurius]
MAYRNKTYVAFDGDNDMWAYAFMKGWNAREHIDFDFHDAHNISELTYRAQNEFYIKSVLRERMKNAKQFILLVGGSTRFLRKYVQWEIELAMNLNIPIIVANLGGLNGVDHTNCPSVLKSHLSVHGPFKKDFIKLAMDDFAPNHNNYARRYSGPVWYTRSF